MELKGKIINFLGDSITEGVGASKSENKYVSVFERLTGAKANNYGISATRIAHQHVSTHGIVDTQAFTARFMDMSDDADAVVVFGGTNDFGHGDAPIGSFTDRTNGTFYGACHVLFEGLVKKYLGKPIVIMTPLHRRNELDPKENNGAVFKTYVDVIREVAEYYSLYVLDLYATSGLQPAIPEVKVNYMPDGLHPNDKGHAVLGYRVAKFLENI